MESDYEARLDHDLEDDLERPELQVVLSGVIGPRQVLHAIGPMTEAGARLLMALVEQAVRKGCTHLRLDLAAVTSVDVVGLRILREFQALMRAKGVMVRFTDPHRRTTQAGLRSIGIAGPGVLA